MDVDEGEVKVEESDRSTEDDDGMDVDEGEVKLDEYNGEIGFNKGESNIDEYDGRNEGDW